MLVVVVLVIITVIAAECLIFITESTSKMAGMNETIELDLPDFIYVLLLVAWLPKTIPN